MPIDPWLPRAAAQHPRRVALEAPEGALTYAQLLEAARLDAAPGSRVALALPPGLEFAIALHACLVARAAAMPVDPRLGEAEQAALMASADLVLDTGSDLAIQQTGNRNAGLQDLTPVEARDAPLTLAGRARFAARFVLGSAAGLVFVPIGAALALRARLARR
jgi:acyl-CoA synthetase (AMP-forming)/AMP-acid ligase II